MDQREQEQRPVRREYGSSTAADSIGQARRVIDQLEARINDARRVPMSKTLSIVDAGELIDLIGQLRIVLPHTVVQAQAILEQQKQILGDAKAEADRTADKADEIYTTTVEKAKQFEQEVKADADAYDKQIRQKAQEDSNAIIEDANTRANQIIFSAQQQSQKLVDDNPDILAAVSPSIYQNGTVKYEKESLTTTCLGVSDKYKEIANTYPESGRSLSYMDVKARQKNCVIGSYIAMELFNGQDPLGKTIKSSGSNFRVVGVMPAKYDSREGTVDAYIYVPYNTLGNGQCLGTS